MKKRVGILTAGTDSPGVNAAIRGFGKAAVNTYQMEVLGFKDGFVGLVENRKIVLEGQTLSGILTKGGTILGTSVQLPNAIQYNGESADLSEQAVANYHANELDALVIIGDRSVQQAAYQLAQKGLNIITMPKASDNDIPGTDKCIGFDSAREIATQAIDRLHTTANATHRIMIVELLGRSSGWLTLGAGLAAGADVILIPEYPYDMNIVANAVKRRQAEGKTFSLVAVAERALPQELVAFMENSARRKAGMEGDSQKALEEIEDRYSGQTMLLARRLEAETGLESRITILGSLVQGGVPTAADRLLATQIAEWSALLVEQGAWGRMACRKDGAMSSVPLEEIAGKGKPIPSEHGWIRGALQVGTCLGCSMESLKATAEWKD
jgi:6-phosphofructokinase